MTTNKMNLFSTDDKLRFITYRDKDEVEEFIFETNIVGNIFVGISIGLKILLIIAAIVMNIFVVSLVFSSIEDCLNDENTQLLKIS